MTEHSAPSPDDLDPMITAEELSVVRDAPVLSSNEVVFDATWTFDGGPAIAETGAVPGALAFDIDALADPSGRYPHMAPTPDAFAHAMIRAGISERSSVTAYDAIGIFSAPRAWWMLRAFGHADDAVFVLDGGLAAWRAWGGDLSDTPTPLANAPALDGETPPFHASGPRLLATKSDVREALDDLSTVIIDARAPARFAGEAAEPRPGLRSGHIPGSRNLPWGAVLNGDKTLKTAADLDAAFAKARVDLGAKRLIALCGSGVSSCVIALALARLGRWDTQIYDGSWAEWGADADLPIAAGLL